MVSSKEDEKAVESQRATVVTVLKDFATFHPTVVTTDN